MKQLIALTEYLKAKKVVPPEQINAWAEDAETQILFKETVNGMECTRATYTAVFEIERYQGDASWLMALIVCWLQQNDQPQREHNDRPAPSWNIDYLGGDLFDIELSIEFVESVYLKADEKGEIECLGKKWNVAQDPAHYATAAELVVIDPGSEHG